MQKRLRTSGDSSVLAAAIELSRDDSLPLILLAAVYDIPSSSRWRVKRLAERITRLDAFSSSAAAADMVTLSANAHAIAAASRATLARAASSSGHTGIDATTVELDLVRDKLKATSRGNNAVPQPPMLAAATALARDGSLNPVLVCALHGVPAGSRGRVKALSARIVATGVFPPVATVADSATPTTCTSDAS